eukprot:1967931-Pyramimonas_sp.AAC.1
MDVPACNEQPAVIQARGDGVLDPIPLTIYVNGVRFISQAAGRSESVLGAWGINLISGKRHFLTEQKSAD